MSNQSTIRINSTMIEAACSAGILNSQQAESLSTRFDEEFHEQVRMLCSFLRRSPSLPAAVPALAYFYAKAVEQSIGYDLYNSQGVFSLPLNPDDIGQNRFASNLPRHLDDLVNAELANGTKLAEDYFARVPDLDPIGPDAASAYYTALCIADTYTLARKLSACSVGPYPNAQLLTPNEYRKLAGEMFLPQLEKQINGCDILEKDFSLDPYFNVIARYQQGLHFILFVVDIAPATPALLSQQFYSLVEEAKSHGASAYVISLSLRAKDETHFRDGVLLRNEPSMYRLNDFKELDIPKSEERLREEEALQMRAEAAIAADRAASDDE